MKPINLRIAKKLGVGEQQVAAAISLLDGATVPFVARYRKETTGALDDAQLRALGERLRYLRMKAQIAREAGAGGGASHLARRSPSALRSDGIIGRHGCLRCTVVPEERHTGPWLSPDRRFICVSFDTAIRPPGSLSL